MDLGRQIWYNGVTAVPVAPAGGGAPVSGIVFDHVDMSAVTAETAISKSANQDGLDVSDANLAGRRIAISGTVYGSSVADAFDHLDELLTAFSPRAAMNADPDNMGFLPLGFDWPTADLAAWSSGYIPQQVYARPEAGLSYNLDRRDRASGPLSIPFRTTLLCRDPRRYLQTEQQIVVSAQTSGWWTGGTVGPYRGSVPVLPKIVFVLASAHSTINIYSYNGAVHGFSFAIDFTGVTMGTTSFDFADKLLRDGNGTPVGKLVSGGVFTPFSGGKIAVDAMTNFSAVTATYHEAWL